MREARFYRFFTRLSGPSVESPGSGARPCFARSGVPYLALMQLFVMRHGPAEESAPSGRDFDRPLSAKGRLRTEAVARELIRRGATPIRILSSPLVRARQTAEIVAAALGRGTVVEIREELAPSEDTPNLVAELTRDGTPQALLVGHAPDVAVLTELLTSQHVSSFAPATVMALSVEARRGTRVFVIDGAAFEQ
jgi:phosphohistidine phosphatase